MSEHPGGQSVLFLFFILLPVLLLPVPEASAADWGDCARGLNRLEKEAREASLAAEAAAGQEERVAAARRRLEAAREEYEDCGRPPILNDLMDEYCENRRRDYEYAKADHGNTVINYEKAVASMRAEISDVYRSIRSVEWSCGVELNPAAGRRHPDIRNNYYCRQMLYYRDTLDPVTLLETCRQYMSLEECRECLDIK